MSSEAPYDPYIPAGGSGATGGASTQQNGNQRTAALQAVSFLPLSSVEGPLRGIRDVQALPPPCMDGARPMSTAEIQKEAASIARCGNMGN